MDLLAELDAHRPAGPAEARDLARLRDLARTPDPWSRSGPVHVTASALVVHPPTGRVLLRWHDRVGAWLHVGGHVDPADPGPAAAARREAREETGLGDLAPWPDPAHQRLVHVAVVPVPAGKGEPAHEHGDLRYLLATSRPGEAVPEHATAPLRWLSLAGAAGAGGHDTLRAALARVAPLLAGHGGDRPRARPAP